ncbi:MAG: hypothetical protein EA379_03750 [Phycisphaerales bacterium]|nr:MAG: hypothetical protein EA379_03750 [Phycisphaerales bacterium]
MAAKLAALIIALALVAGALLAVRQQRIMAAHEMVRAHTRIVERERDLWRLRLEIARHLSPERIEQIAASLGPMRPAPPDGDGAINTGVLAGAPVPNEGAQ